MNNRIVRRSMRALAFVTVRIALVGIVSLAHGQNAQSPTSSGTNQKHGPLQIVAKSAGTSRVPSASGASAPMCVDSVGNPGTCLFNDYGGPVISNIDVVVVYWSSSISSVVNCGDHDSLGNCIGISQFHSAVVNSTYLDMLGEYNTKGVNATAGSKIGMPGTQVIGRGTLHSGSPFIIIPSNLGTMLSDSDIQKEIQSQIAANHLPAPATDSLGNVNTTYMVYFPPGVTISLPGNVVSCAAGGFCGYHSTYKVGNLGVPYGVIPDFGKGSGCDIGCGLGTQWQNITSTTSHELGEAITDTAVGLATGTTFDYPLTWYDVNNGEIGDPCDVNGSEVALQFGATTFVVQQLFSQKAYKLDHNAGCVSPGTPTFTLTAPASSTLGIAFDVKVTANNGDGSNYLGTIHFTSSDGSASLPTNYTFTSADANTHTFTGGVTLNTGGADAITVSDARQTSNPGGATVNVGTQPTTISVGSSGNPSLYGQPVTLTASVTSPAAGTPTGSVTFFDGANQLGSGTLNAQASANLSTSSLSSGSHTINAMYGGDPTFSASSSPPLTQAVNQASTSTTVSSIPNPSLLENSVLLTANVTPTPPGGGTPDGSVQFFDGTTSLGTAPLTGGMDSLSVSGLAQGTHNITAMYSGSSNYVASTSPMLVQIVLKKRRGQVVSQ